MGLDMYAMSVSAGVVGDKQVDIKARSKSARIKELAYWRKFNHLHGWMEKLYRAKGGKAESFNCVTVRLDPADLDALEAATGDPEKSLPATEGFFFGPDQLYPEDIPSIKTFIAKAREEIAMGRVVLYDSWW